MFETGNFYSYICWSTDRRMDAEHDICHIQWNVMQANSYIVIGLSIGKSFRKWFFVDHFLGRILKYYQQVVSKAVLYMLRYIIVHVRKEGSGNGGYR